MRFALFYVLVEIIMVCNVSSRAQITPKIQWQKCLGGSNADYPGSVIETKDGGYITVGYSNSIDGDITNHYGGTDVWIVKQDVYGNIKWQKTYGEIGVEFASDIKQTFDMGYIICGERGPNGWIFKIDSIGNLEWQKEYPSIDTSRSNHLYFIITTKDGGYLALGNDYGLANGLIIKLDSLGKVEWQKTYGGTDQDYIYKGFQAENGSYTLIGESSSKDGDVTHNNGGKDVWVMKLDSIGNIEWQKTYGGSSDDGIGAVLSTIDGGIIFSGYSESKDGDVSVNRGYDDAWIVKLNSTGGIEWQKTYGGSNKDAAIGIINTSDGGYIIGAYSYSNDYNITGNHGSSDYWLLKLDSIGQMQWQKNYGGSSTDILTSIIQSDKNFVMTGYSFSNDNDVEGNHGEWDYWTIKLDELIINSTQLLYNNCLKIWPNPINNGQLTIEGEELLSNIEIYNILGERVAQKSSIGKLIQLNLEGLPNGVYVAKVLSA